MKKYNVEVGQEKYVITSNQTDFYGNNLGNKYIYEQSFFDDEHLNKTFDNKDKAIEYANSIKLSYEVQGSSLYADFVEVYEFDEDNEDDKESIYNNYLKIDELDK